MSEDKVIGYRFDSFHLDLINCRLLHGNRPIRLTPRLFDLLLLLLRKNRKLVTKEDLIREVWAGRMVEENNITVSISLLRKMLDQESSQQNYIETVPRRGYIFSADVRPIKEAVGVLAQPWESGDEEQLKDSNYNDKTTYVAVLPLINEVEDLHLGYLADRITETIVSLSRLPLLRIIRCNITFLHKNPGLGTRELGRLMGVQTVLSGRIKQVEDRLLVSLELVNVSDGYQLWEEHFNYTLSNLHRLQHDIAVRIAKKFTPYLCEAEIRPQGKHYTTNSEAFQLYLKGRYFWRKRGLKNVKRAIECFEQATTLDPDYALAYVGLADAYNGLSGTYCRPKEIMPSVKAFAEKALELDNHLAEAHVSLAGVKIHYEWDWDGGRKELELALKYNPHYAFAHQWYRYFLEVMGRFSDALVELNIAREIDPYSVNLSSAMAWLLYLTRQFDRALIQVQHTIDMAPDYHPSYEVLGRIQTQLGSYEDAIVSLLKSKELDDSPDIRRFLGYTYAIAGNSDKALETINELSEMSKVCYISPYNIAVIYAGLNKNDEAFRWLEKAYEERDDGLVWLKSSLELDNIRSDTRFNDLLRRMGFPNEES
ncbi:MAG: winged helix-turn-helix domain-containing protein [Acidobacteriota bacterium]|nr:winged helix-turn-helix domain-containing protein [Acidobacteriota bacterium]